MRQTPDRLREIASHLKGKMNLRSLIVTLAAIVVFTTTYMLILPAFTLDSQSAAEQGGIDVPAVETTAEDTSDSTDSAAADENAAANDANANANQAEASGETKADQSAEKADTKAKDPDESAAKVKDADPEKADVKLLTGKKTITARQGKGDDFAVSAVVSTDAKVPADVTITATELGKNTDGFDYDQYKDDALAALKKDSSDVKSIKSIKFYDISLESDSQDKSVEPSAPVSVKISYEDGMKVSDADNIRIVHFAEQKNGSEKAQVLDAKENKVETTTAANGSKVTEASFDTDGFSKYAVVEVETIEKTVITADGKTYKVSVSYDKNAKIPEGSELEVKELTGDDYDAYLEKAASKLDKNAEDLGMAKFFDITIRNGDDEVKIASPVDVEIKLLDSDSLADSTQVLHFASEEKADVVDSKVDGDTVKFEAEGFSVYAVVEGSTGDNARATVNFYGKPGADGKPALVATYYVKNGDVMLGDGTRDTSKQYIEDIVADPGIGGKLEADQSFRGWYIAGNNADDYTGTTEPKTIEDVQKYLEELQITEGDVVDVYAMIFKHYYITYYGDDANVALGTHTALARLNDTEAPYTVNMAYSADEHHEFRGWKATTETGSNIQGWTADSIYTNGTEITVTGDVVFNVEAPEGNWLVYNTNGKGGTYNAPQFYLFDEVTEPAINARPGNMKRNGYKFGGWYTDPGCTEGNEFTFGSTLSDNTNIYAKWEPNERAPYTVILWGQNADRSAYEVIGSYVNNEGLVGQNIPYSVVENGDEDYVTGVGNGNGHYTGFSIKDADKNQQVEIKPEGDAVLNLHFDRIEYNFKFYLYRDGIRNNRYDYANNSGSGRTLDDLVTWHEDERQHPSVTGETIQSETVGGRTYYYFVMNAYYGEDISSKWPTYDKITGANNREAVSYVMMVGTKLKPSPTNQGSGTVKGIITVLDENILGKTNDANGNYVMIRFPDNYYNWRYHIWFEAADGVAPAGKTTHVHNGKTYYEETVLTVRSSNTTDANQNEPKYQGFDYVTRMGQNNQGVWGGGHWTTGNNPTLYHLNYIYDRQKFKIEYFDGNYVDGNGNSIQNRATHLLDESGEIAHGAVIPDSDKNYVPTLPEGESGYVFEGWYLDESCTIPYPWGKMPVGGIKVYAKWRQIQYRVFLHPNAGESGSNDLSWGDEQATQKQEMNFRISYGEKVSTPTGTITGKEFAGWYLDPQCTQVFSEDTILNEITVTTPYDKTKDFTDPMDKWGHGATTNSDITGYGGGDRFWITKKFDLYAKWRDKLVGADGVNVVYNVGELGQPGSEPTDAMQYLDAADAVAQAACHPADDTEYKFHSWVVQKWNGQEYVDTGVEVYPGQTFTIKSADAKVEPDPEDPAKQIYTIQLRATYTPLVETVPTHITWYANNGSGETITDDSVGTSNPRPLQINEAVDVRDSDTFTNPGHVFLGWARLVEETDGDGNVITIGGVSTQNLNNESLGENDLWLKYDAEHNKYVYAKTADGIAAGTEIKQVAADERLQYHGLVAVWEKKSYTVTVIKEIDAGTAVAGDDEIPFEFTPSFTGYDDEEHTRKFSLVSKPEGTSTYAHQKVYENISYGTSVTLTEAPGDLFNLDSVKYTVTGADDPSKNVNDKAATISNNGTTLPVEGNTTITFTNKKKIFNVSFAKKDETGTKDLTGSTFQLNKKNESGTYVKYLDDNIAPGAESEPDYRQLPSGDYELVELTAPEGYIIIERGLKFSISASGEITIAADCPTLDDGTKIASVSGSTVIVRNVPGKPLPSTGGIGTTIFYILGSLLVIGCGIVLISRRGMGSDK